MKKNNELIELIDALLPFIVIYILILIIAGSGI